MRIDPHVHLRDEEESHKGTIRHELEIAKKQGIDMVFDMPNCARPVLTEKDVQRRIALVPPSSKEMYKLYIGATADSQQLTEAAALVESYNEVIGIKMFAGKSTGNLALVTEEEQSEVYSNLKDIGYKGVLAVHCEKESFMDNSFDPMKPISHARSRPPKAEIESVKDQIKFAKDSGFEGILHIVHVSTAESLRLIQEARESIKITCAVTPHHVLWGENKMFGQCGILFKMNPPLRGKEDVKALRIGLARGTVDFIETDHAPHAIGEKLYDSYPSGFPSLYLYKYFVETFLPTLGLGPDRIDELCYKNIVRIFGL